MTNSRRGNHHAADPPKKGYRRAEAKLRRWQDLGLDIAFGSRPSQRDTRNRNHSGLERTEDHEGIERIFESQSKRGRFTKRGKAARAVREMSEWLTARLLGSRYGKP